MLKKIEELKFIQTLKGGVQFELTPEDGGDVLIVSFSKIRNKFVIRQDSEIKWMGQSQTKMIMKLPPLSTLIVSDLLLPTG